jgi:hypothetical protein
MPRNRARKSVNPGSGATFPAASSQYRAVISSVVAMASSSDIPNSSWQVSRPGRPATKRR